MSSNQRLALLAGAVVVLVLGFVIAKSGSDDDNSKSDTTTTPAAASTTTTADTGGTPAKPAVATVVVKDAKPVGGVKTLKFDKGDTIRFKVQSDTADEIHFHGYDVAKDVEAGGTVSFSVPGKIDGKFEVELEDHKQQIASVEVAP
jgi:hypothetical protein